MWGYGGSRRVDRNFLRERETGETQDIPGCHPNCDCERFVELWNLVFMQFYQDPERNRTPLPAPSVDTGMGLERAAAVLQNKPNVYETDIFRPIVDKACDLSGKEYGKDRETDYALRVVAEHARAASFLIGDGVVPGNEGRGYVLRRVIRRAIRYGRRLGLAQPFLTQVAQVVLERFAPVYGELDENGEFILRVIGLEEERFSRTFERGNDILRGMVTYRERTLAAREQVVQADNLATALPADHLGGNESENMGAQLAKQYLVEAAADDAPRGGVISALIEGWGSAVTGKETFVLYDTYGFPPELTAEMAREQGLEVDTEGFEREMESQREQSRSSQGFTGAMEMLTAYENLESMLPNSSGTNSWTGRPRLQPCWWTTWLRGTLLRGSPWKYCWKTRPSMPRTEARLATRACSPAPTALCESRTPRVRWPDLSSTGE